MKKKWQLTAVKAVNSCQHTKIAINHLLLKLGTWYFVSNKLIQNENSKIFWHLLRAVYSFWKSVTNSKIANTQ